MNWKKRLLMSLIVGVGGGLLAIPLICIWLAWQESASIGDGVTFRAVAIYAIKYGWKDSLQVPTWMVIRAMMAGLSTGLVLLGRRQKLRNLTNNC